MANSTGQSLITKMLSRAGNLSTAYTTMMTDGLTDAIDELATGILMPQMQELESTANAVIAAGSGTRQTEPYTQWANDVWIPIYLSDQSNQNPMTKVDIRILDIETSEETAEVTRYALWNGEFVFAPAFLNNTTLQLRYISTTARITSDGTSVTGSSPFPQEYDSLVRLLGLSFALVAINKQLASDFGAQAGQRMASLQGREDYHNMMNQPVTVRPRFRGPRGSYS